MVLLSQVCTNHQTLIFHLSYLNQFYPPNSHYFLLTTFFHTHDNIQCPMNLPNHRFWGVGRKTQEKLTWSLPVDSIGGQDEPVLRCLGGSSSYSYATLLPQHM